MEYILFGTFHMINDIWYSSPAKQAPYITLVTVYVQAHRCAAHCYTGNVFWQNTKKNPKAQSKAYLQHPFFFSDNQICELIRTTLQKTDKHTVAPSQAVTNTQTHNSNQHFLNVNNMSPAPPSLEERDRKRKGESVRDPNDGRAVLIIFFCITLFVFISLPFVSIHFQMNPLITPRLWSPARDTQINWND